MGFFAVFGVVSVYALAIFLIHRMAKDGEAKLG